MRPSCFALLAALLLPVAAGAAEALPPPPAAAAAELPPPPTPADAAALPPPPPAATRQQPPASFPIGEGALAPGLPPPPGARAEPAPASATPQAVAPTSAGLTIAEAAERLPERPSPPPYDPDATTAGVYVRNATTWIWDPAFDLVGEDDTLNRMEVGLSFQPGWLDGALLFEAGYAGGAKTARAFQQFDATLTLQSIQLGAIYRQPVGRFSRPYARVMPSLDFAHLSLEDDGATELDDIALTFGVEAVLGWELLLGVGGETEDRRPAAHLSLCAELGYAFRPVEAHFDGLSRDVAGGTTDPERITALESDAGQLDLSGLVLRFGLAYRF